MRKRGTIRIEVKSDICMGSGYAYAGVIDSDLDYDELGIPFIPAKRFKGCMREAAEKEVYALVSGDEIEQLFGVPGEDGVKGVMIENAYIENYDEIYQTIKQMKEESGTEKYLKKQNILECFTTIKAQTRMKDGVAEDNSLRYMRVMNAISPLKEKKEALVFEAKIYFEETDQQKQQKKIEHILAAVRHIGMYRNRGLGNVRCTLEHVEEAGKNKEITFLTSNTEKKTEIWYKVENMEPLMLCNASDQKSDSYIRGRAVLGALAGAYLRLKNHTAKDKAFYDLFLNGETIFSNLVPAREGKPYYPAPMFLNRLKKTKEMVNTQFTYDKTKHNVSYNPDNGNQPKKLRGKYINMDNFDVLEVPMQIIYHHRGGAQGEIEPNTPPSSDTQVVEEQLFGWKAVKKKQTFIGKIIVPQDYKKSVEKLLESCELRFGKSKTAQYGKCKATILKENPEPLHKVELKAGEYVMVSLLSDGIFINDRGYTTQCEEVEKLIANELGICVKKIEENFYSMIQVKEIYGYQSVWNLRREPMEAVAAGSTFVYQLAQDAKLEKEYIGEKNLEGYGHVRFWNLSNMSYQVQKKEEGDKKNKEEKKECKPELVKGLVKLAAKRVMLDQVKVKALQDQTKLKLTASTIGRVTLMLRESIEKNAQDSKAAFSEFCERIESIKRKKEREDLEKEILDHMAKRTKIKDNKSEWSLEAETLPYYSGVMGKDGVFKDPAALKKEKSDTGTKKEEWESSMLKDLAALKKDESIAGIKREEWESMMIDMWEEYLKTCLTYLKYKKKEEESA